MNYKKIPEYSREEALSEINSGDPERIVYAILSLSFYNEDRALVENLCIEYSKHDNDNIRGIAILCFGHLARIHGELNINVIKPIIKRALKDKSEFIRGHADSAMDDIKIFIKK